MSGRDHTTSDAVFRRRNIQIKTALKAWQCLQCCFILYEFNISQKYYDTSPCLTQKIQYVLCILLFEFLLCSLQLSTTVTTVNLYAFMTKVKVRNNTYKYII